MALLGPHLLYFKYHWIHEIISHTWEIITWKFSYPNSNFSLLLVQKTLLCSAQSLCIIYNVDEKTSFPENNFSYQITQHQVNKSWMENLGKKYFEARFIFSSAMLKLVKLTMHVATPLPLMLDFISNWIFLMIYFWEICGPNIFFPFCLLCFLSFSELYIIFL